MQPSAAKTVAELVVEFLVARGVDRVFGLQGGHIQPIWDQLAQRGVRIVDVRDEGAAVHMAHAHAVLTGGVGVAMVTAGPGVTNCVTAMANAQLERVPVLLIGGCAPRAQDDLGPLQGIAHVDIMRPVTRSVAHAARRRQRAARPRQGLRHRAAATAASPGAGVRRDPDRRAARDRARRSWCSTSTSTPKPTRRIPPDPADVERAAAHHRRGAPSAGRDRPRRARRAARHSLRFLDAHRRGLSRHAGKPRPRAGEHRVGGRRRARPRDAGSRSR